ncbi:MAG: lipocalin-like domain-containing protein [Bacteroidetes bacterium]|jgi:hypothetical protein|nr:lipocalin-like domain-containing protein [Bacteroidota bacterium]MDA0973259.1 lipocalin-like domain-containing protein [Bacteroidota bacterium]
MKYLCLALLILFIFNACTPDEPAVAKGPPLAGLWSLYAMEQKDSVTGEWMDWRGGMQGYILYDADGHMALHLTKKDYQDFELTFPNFVDTIPMEALRHLTNSYVYLANYTLDTVNHIVEHARVSHSNPAEWNGVVQRRYGFIGDTLVLAPVEEKNKSLRLKWVKQ